MKKILLLISIFLCFVVLAHADTYKMRQNYQTNKADWVINELSADSAVLWTGNFDNNLSSSDTEVQTALETIDDIVIGGAQNIWKTMSADTGTVNAASTTDTFGIVGGSNISTAISGKTVTITNTAVGGSGDLKADGTVPLTANWDVGNFDITLKALTGDGTIEGATLTEGGNAVYNATETPGGELGGTFASFTIDDSVAVTSWNLTTPTITTSIDLPAGAINTATEIAADIITYTQTADADQRDTKCVTIETPADADDFLWFRCDTAYTITSIDAICEAATSAVVVVNECDSAGDNCGAANTKLEESITAIVTGAADDGTLGNPDVAAGNWLRLQVGTVTGTPGHVTTCVTYNYAD